jgi:hypothetical protein
MSYKLSSLISFEATTLIYETSLFSIYPYFLSISLVAIESFAKSPESSLIPLGLNLASIMAKATQMKLGTPDDNVS